MRSVLTLALLGLGLVLALNADAGLYDRFLGDLTPRPGHERGTTVRIYSTGQGMQPANNYRRGTYEAIIVDGDLLRTDYSQPGLRVLFFRPGTEEQAYANYDLASSDADVSLLLRRLEAVPEDTCLAMAARQNVCPSGEGADARTRVLDELFSAIGSSEPPLRVPGASWAFLAVRRDGRWHPVSEATSTVRGVGIACQLSDDLSTYDEVVPDVRVVESVEACLVDLYPNGHTQIDPFTFVKRGDVTWFTINGSPMSGIQMSPPFGPAYLEREEKDDRLAFPMIRLGPDPVFETDLAVESWHHETCKGVEFQLWVDGELVGAKQLRGEVDTPDGWNPWELDLSAWRNQWVVLELRTRRVHLPETGFPKWQEPAIWGNPRIRMSRPGPRDEVEPRTAFFDLLDRNGDGMLQADEAVDRISRFDADGDGDIPVADVPEVVRPMLAELDVDGDGVVRPSDVEAWFEARARTE